MGFFKNVKKSFKDYRKNEKVEIPTPLGKKKIGIDQLIYLLSVVVLTITVVFPMGMILYSTFFQGLTFDITMFKSVVLNSDNIAAVWNTIKIAVAVTFFGTVMGLFFGWLMGRSNIPLKGVMKNLFNIPYMFPPLFGAMAWSLLLSPRSGYINQLYMSFTGGTTPLFNINTIWGIIFVETCYFFPFVYMQVVSALERMDPTLEESARIAGAGQWYVIKNITDRKSVV